MTQEITLTEISANGLNNNFVELKNALDTKAELEGDSTQEFKVADAIEQTEAINKKQLDNAVNSINSAVSKLETEIEAELAAKLDESDTTVTKQGNTFNSAGQLVQLNLSGQLPELDGSLLTGISSATLGTSDMPALTNNSTDADNDIDISSGFCWDDSLTVKLQLSSALTKQLDATWDSGNNAGGLDTGSKAVSTWYHVFLISNGTNTDVLFSTSATSPTMPTGFVNKRRIGAVRTNSSGNIITFKQKGNYFTWNSSSLDLYGATATPTSKTLLTVSVPPLCRGLFNISVNPIGNGGCGVFAYDGTVSGDNYFYTNTNNGFGAGNYGELFVNSSSQIYYSTELGVMSYYYIRTLGYIDMRGAK